MSLIVIGGSGGTNIADALFKAAIALNFDAVHHNTSLAYKAPWWIRKINWHLRGKYPSNLIAFNQKVVQTCRNSQIKLLLTTGIAPISQLALKQIGAMGIQRLNFLTDDPWNSAHYAPWFFQTLSHYDIIFSPRRANLDDLLKVGCQRVQYLPFGYDPDLFYPEDYLNPMQDEVVPDVVFAGGADNDRIAYMNLLIKAGIHLDLYGNYWEAYPETRSYTQGQADVQTLRRAIRRAKVALCLVRRANRDGHCMRSFEVPAVGACMLTEDTQEHREIFGEEGQAVIYFRTIPEMVEKTQWLLNHDAERQRLAQSVYTLITQGQHTYKDRLKTMLSLTEYLQ
ncbi:glycosyltransferase [Calothrix sp. PCC 7507]|uniref:CgeB family protein n=1 Tax=Calothrix sp. PCC 7507 TaxID=99598 RepID=UPI00029F3B3F|nr:glycosyltransferase [Calothrix sp. PCC 7507]AFY34224.1 hypothetical protein Cal7507_3836 [Calothrix sp. PCC 7507]